MLCSKQFHQMASYLFKVIEPNVSFKCIGRLLAKLNILQFYRTSFTCVGHLLGFRTPLVYNEHVCLLIYCAQHSYMQHNMDICKFDILSAKGLHRFYLRQESAKKSHNNQARQFEFISCHILVKQYKIRKNVSINNNTACKKLLLNTMIKVRGHFQYKRLSLSSAPWSDCSRSSNSVQDV